MSFVRPELAAAARRWREAWVGGFVCTVALWAWIAGRGVVPWLGVPLAVCGLALIWVGVQRGRFRGPSDGPGVVQVTEAQLAYFGPLSGGVVAVDALESVLLDPSGTPLHWVLLTRDDPALHIPVTAQGADALMDAFAQLPGFRMDRALRHLEQPGDVALRVWARPGAAPLAMPRLRDPRQPH